MLIDAKLGFSLDSMFEKDGLLYFTGTALESGVWFGIKGKPVYWNVEVIQNGMRGFLGKPLTCEHNFIIGSILDVYPTELGFGIKGVITSKKAQLLVLSGELTGLSITSQFYANERNIATQLINQKDISIVKEPACRVCRLKDIWIDNMTEETIVEQVSVITDIDDDVVAMSTDADVTPVEDTVIDTELSAKVAEQELQIAELMAEVSVLKTHNAELAQLAEKMRDEYEVKARADLESAVLSADPTADLEKIKTFSNDALTMYLNAVMKFTKQKTMPAPKGVTVKAAPVKTETVVKPPVSANKESHAMMREYLKSKQTEK